MPKIIENLESRILAEARKQIESSGYGTLTIRSVAKECGVGIGTVYNYFPSKDALVASYMLQDWKSCLEVITRVSRETDSPECIVRCMFDQLKLYTVRHQALFLDDTAAAVFAESFSRYHTMLRRQLAEPLLKYCGSEFAGEFVAEALLTWTMAGIEFDELYGMIRKLF